MNLFYVIFGILAGSFILFVGIIFAHLNAVIALILSMAGFIAPLTIIFQTLFRNHSEVKHEAKKD